MDCSDIAEAVERRSARPRRSSGGIAVPELEVGERGCMKAVERQSRERAE
jgi:hypothetical protein